MDGKEVIETLEERITGRYCMQKQYMMTDGEYYR